MMATVLVVEDEPKLAQLLADYLAQASYDSHIISEGGGVIEWVKQNQPDLVLLDLMLPGVDGLTLCREIRIFSEVPIIMVTARVEEIDRLLGLELGADDYICKPFSPREVVARVKTVLRRTYHQSDYRSSSLQVTPSTEHTFQLDEEKHQVHINGVPLSLTAIEFNLLKVMAKEPGRIFSRAQLIDRIYRDHRIVSERTVDSHIKKLRRKLSEAVPGSDYVQSVYSVGYKLDFN
ncbi:response regulator [Vibrio sp. Of7-15]|uniref:response regulator n=1 Tax=Vibrio sp. Of7-15 TaxID=2724879 RepID=UPI001EF16F02|nr:response regulator [Vibrio sp. Of7-15]MCG7497212.1 response regulator [Vibrio sp. Of7-15]